MTATGADGTAGAGGAAGGTTARAAKASGLISTGNNWCGHELRRRTVKNTKRDAGLKCNGEKRSK